MKIYKKITTSLLCGYRCDVCGTFICDHTNEAGGKCCPAVSGTASGSCNFHVKLEGSFGYGSNKDMETHICHLCEQCYDKVRQYIECVLEGKVQVIQHWFGGNSDGKEEYLDYDNLEIQS